MRKTATVTSHQSVVSPLSFNLVEACFKEETRRSFKKQELRAKTYQNVQDINISADHNVTLRTLLWKENGKQELQERPFPLTTLRAV